MTLRIKALRDCFSSLTTFQPKLPILEKMHGSEGNYSQFMRVLKTTYNREGKDLVEIALEKLGEDQSWNSEIANANKQANAHPNSQKTYRGILSKEGLRILEIEIQRQQEVYFPAKKHNVNKGIIVLVGCVFLIGLAKWLNTYSASQSK